MPGKRVYLMLVASIATLFVISACSEQVIPTQEPVEFQPTAAGEIDRPDSSGEDNEPVVEAPVTGAGDADAGRNLFVSCSACHATDDKKVVGPGLGGVYARAGDRTSLDADAYIKQSIREPNAFVVDSFSPLMPSFDYLSESDVLNLIAYLKTLD
ncbi:MAG: cytochrome c [Dehalococcoidia bacterium]|nr:cytochrome c [Dehalococcoidia bacterium]